MKRVLFFFFFFSIQVLAVQIDMRNEAPGPGTGDSPGSGSGSCPKYIPPIEEMRRQEAEYQVYLANREAKYQKILAQVAETSKPSSIPTLELSKLLPSMGSLKTVEENNQQVERVLKKLDTKRLNSLVANFQTARPYSFMSPAESDKGECSILH